MQLSLTLASRDLERTENFYRELLGLDPQFSRAAENFPPFLLLRCGPTCVVFQQAKVLEAQHPALLQNLTRHPFGVGVQLELSCEDLSTVRQAIDRHQWPLAYELDDQQHQRREIWLHDPDGYLLVLNQESAGAD